MPRLILDQVQNLVDAKSKCTDAIYNNLMTNYCSTNKNPAQWGVAAFANQNNMTGSSSTCAASGCNKHSCPSVTPAPLAAKRVFVTSTTYNGNLGGLAGADSKCQARANAANLGGTWRAWLSDSNTSATSRLNHNSGSYKLLNGVTVANNWIDLTDGILQNPISMTELRTNVIWGVWSNTDQSGIKIGANCANWTVTSDGGFAGFSTASDVRWTNNNNLPCNDSYKSGLYCFEQ